MNNNKYKDLILIPFVIFAIWLIVALVSRLGFLLGIVIWVAVIAIIDRVGPKWTSHKWK